ncbi:DUF4998 domain-containing protein [Echinicola strongylocentroti]|nr:DUF4998 domain-containing protein [Echinicola strongylocentroti]
MISNITKVLLVMIMGAGLVACETTMETYDEFLVDGETVYVGKADSVMVEEGFEKLKFNIAINADPKITKGLINTIDETIHHEFEVNRKHAGADTITVDMELPEGEYTFGVFFFDDYGNSSIREEVTARVYGEAYIDRLMNRAISNMEMNDQNELTINWSSPIGTSTYTQLTYEDPMGEVHSIEVPNEDSETIIEAVKEGSELTIITAYRPTSTSFEDFMANPSVVMVPDISLP